MTEGSEFPFVVEEIRWCNFTMILRYNELCSNYATKLFLAVSFLIRNSLLITKRVENKVCHIGSMPGRFCRNQVALIKMLHSGAFCFLSIFPMIDHFINPKHWANSFNQQYESFLRMSSVIMNHFYKFTCCKFPVSQILQRLLQEAVAMRLSSGDHSHHESGRSSPTWEAAIVTPLSRWNSFCFAAVRCGSVCLPVFRSRSNLKY